MKRHQLTAAHFEALSDVIGRLDNQDCRVSHVNIEYGTPVEIRIVVRVDLTDGFDNAIADLENIDGVTTAEPADVTVDEWFHSSSIELSLRVKLEASLGDN